MNPSPFQIAQSVGNQFGKAVRAQGDKSAIDEILSQASQSGNPNDINNAMGKILSRVSAERQPMAMNILKNKMAEIQNKRTQEADVDLGFPSQFGTASQEAQKGFIKNREASMKVQKESRESDILAKIQRGEQITPEEQSELSPTSQRTLIGTQKPVFEPTEERLEAERVSSLATEIENDFKASKSEEMRLNRMTKLDESGELSTPMMIKTLNKLGFPLGVLGNPNSEEFVKLEADFLRDVRQVFPGGRITNYEIQAYLKTVPGLMNSQEGRRSIIRNRKLINESKQLRYEAYRKILKENNGRKPRNMGLLIEDNIQDRIVEIEDKFRDGIQNNIEMFQQPIRMKDSNGNTYDIPPNKVSQASKQGLTF